jgi:para-aminobenzoate synthetase / 4-amino-4-deoxychorismate lyase
VARAAEAPFVLLVESHAEPERERGLLFDAPRRIVSCREPAAVSACLEQLDAEVRRGRFVAGFLAYEAGYGLQPKLSQLGRSSDEHALWFGVFDECRELRGIELGQWLARDDGDARVTEPRFDRSHPDYAADFAKVQAHLRAGDSYQVCQSLRARFELSGSPRALFRKLRAAQRTCYSALIDTGEYSLLSLSPELFYRKCSGRLELEPMKGTAAAQGDAAADAALAELMRTDPKTRAENVMIVDLLRNDVGRLATPGSVRVPKLFTVERWGSVLQMTSTITAEVDPELGLATIMKSLFPSGSVTGAPKLRTMQIIRELEPSPRGIFCGSIGYVTPQNDACFNVAIRTLRVLPDGDATLGVGSGVVIDSDCDAERAECLLKARFVTDAAR